MRTEFLLSAYRRLDAASNRPLTSARREDLESALADIQLLGTAAHVALAQKFVTEFASSKEADTTAILRALRISLRRELLLDDVAPELKFLRVKEGDDWAEHSASVRANTARLPGESAPTVVPSASPRLEVLADEEPTIAVVEAYSAVESHLRANLGRVIDDIDSLSTVELARRGAHQGLIGPQTANALETLTVMRNLAVHRPGGIAKDEATEFVALSDAVLFALEQDLATRKN